MTAPTVVDRLPVEPQAAPADPTRRPQWMTVLAVAALAIPFGILLVRFLLASGHVYLPDDLALIDLHTRIAVQWRQELGPFDRFGWNHPGPSLFYLLGLSSRVLGPGARAEFFGATLINALAAIGTVWVVRRRAGPAAALWAAICVGFLAIQLSFVGPSSVTYSESVLGIIASPWNATVIILPMMLFGVLCAAAPARSPLSLVGALVLGSFIVQTDISTAPLVGALFVVSLVACAGGAVWDRRARLSRQGVVAGGVAGVEGGTVGGGTVEGGTLAVGGEVSPPPVPRESGWTRRARWWGLAGLVVFVAMWVPPLIQQFTVHPGNLTDIYRFFTAPPPTAKQIKAAGALNNLQRLTNVHSAFVALKSVDGMLVFGTSEVMNVALVFKFFHPGIVTAATWLLLVIGVAVGVVGVAWRNRFGACLGVFSIVGFLATIFGLTRLEGFIYGYLAAWEVVVPVMALIGVGVVLAGRWERRTAPDDSSKAGPRGVRVGLAVLALVVCGVLSFRMVVLPPLSAVSDPAIGKVLSMVTPRLDHGEGPVLVGYTGTAIPSTLSMARQNELSLEVLTQDEEFIGVVNQLDADGYDPKIGKTASNAQFGPGFTSNGRERVRIQLSFWTPSAARQPGYLGRAGGLAVSMTGAPAPG